MFRRPYLTAVGLSLIAMVGIGGQMVVPETYKIVFLGLTTLPLALALACARWR